MALLITNKHNKITIDWNGLDYSRTEMVDTIAAIFAKNENLCSLKEKKDFLYDLIRLSTFKKENHINNEKEEKLIDIVFNVGNPEYKFEIRSLTVPIELIRKMEKMIGNKTFNVIDALNQIKKRYPENNKTVKQDSKIKIEGTNASK